MMEWKIFLFNLLPSFLFNVGAKQDILITKFIYGDSSFWPDLKKNFLNNLHFSYYRAPLFLQQKVPDDGVDASHLVCHLPGTLETPSILSMKVQAI